MENFQEQRKVKLSFPITLPVTINAVSPTVFLPVTVTADSITTTGHWSPLFPHLDPTIAPKMMSLTLPTRLSFPATITVATNTFTAAVLVTDKRTVFKIIVDNGPRNRSISLHSHHAYHRDLTSTLSITSLPIIFTFIFDHDNNNNNNINNNDNNSNNADNNTNNNDNNTNNNDNNNNNANNNNNDNDNNNNNNNNDNSNDNNNNNSNDNNNNDNNNNNNSDNNNNTDNNSDNNNNNNSNAIAIHLTISENSMSIDGHPLIESTTARGKPSMAAVLLMANNDIPDVEED